MNDTIREPEFVPGLELAEGFYRDAVRPLLEDSFPGLKHSAALLGHGSEVMGFDTAMSRDHSWGPRVMLFLGPADHHAQRDALTKYLADHLPPTYRGYPTGFSEPDPNDKGTQVMQAAVAGPVNHRVEVLTIEGFFRDYLGISPDDTLAPADWLTLPHQKLRAITFGKVFHDDLGLGRVRSTFAWYPHDVWLYVLASAWQRLGQDEHLMGRAGEAGDEMGSAVTGARLVRECMRLAFLMEKQYPPYAKWLGTAFARLESAPVLAPHLSGALLAGSWQEREKHLCAAYEALAERHNSLGLTAPLPARVAPFWGRPFRVIKGEAFTAALLDAITDPAVKTMPFRSPIGSIDLISDNTDLLEDPAFRPGVRRLYA